MAYFDPEEGDQGDSSVPAAAPGQDLDAVYNEEFARQQAMVSPLPKQQARDPYTDQYYKMRAAAMKEPWYRRNQALRRVNEYAQRVLIPAREHHNQHMEDLASKHESELTAAQREAYRMAMQRMGKGQDLQETRRYHTSMEEMQAREIEARAAERRAEHDKDVDPVKQATAKFLEANPEALPPGVSLPKPEKEVPLKELYDYDFNLADQIAKTQTAIDAGTHWYGNSSAVKGLQDTLAALQTRKAASEKAIEDKIKAGNGTQAAAGAALRRLQPPPTVTPPPQSENPPTFQYGQMGKDYPDIGKAAAALHGLNLPPFSMEFKNYTPAPPGMSQEAAPAVPPPTAASPAAGRSAALGNASDALSRYQKIKAGLASDPQGAAKLAQLRKAYQMQYGVDPEGP